MEDLMDNRKNFLRYRKRLKASVLPALPYFGMFLRDITFLGLGNSNVVLTGENKEQVTLINIEKQHMAHNIISQLHRYQEVPYSFHIVVPIANFLTNLTMLYDDALYHHSLLCEKKTEEV